MGRGARANEFRQAELQGVRGAWELYRSNPLLIPGDIVLFNTDESVIGYAIRKITRKTGERRTYANHVAMVISQGPALDSPLYYKAGIPGRAVIADAQPPKVREGKLERYIGDFVKIVRAKNLTLEQRIEVAAHAEDFVGKPYGYGKILLHMLGLQNLSFIDWMPICSYTVAVPYGKLGLDFGVKGRAATPDDIDDFTSGHPEIYEVIKPWGVLGE